MSHELTAYFSVSNLFFAQLMMAISSKECKSDNFELRNSLKFSFTNIWGLRSNFVECESFLESNSLGILAQCETNVDGLFDSSNFSVRGYLPLIRKDFITDRHGLAIYLKERLPFARNLSLENVRILSYVFDWLHFTRCLTSFSSFDRLLRQYARFFILFHLT